MLAVFLGVSTYNERPTFGAESLTSGRQNSTSLAVGGYFSKPGSTASDVAACAIAQHNPCIQNDNQPLYDIRYCPGTLVLHAPQPPPDHSLPM